MKNKFLLVLTLIFSMILPSCVFVSFSSMATQKEETYILDETGTLKENEISELNKTLKEISSKYKIGTFVALIDKEAKITAKGYIKEFETKDNIVFVISKKDRKWAIEASGKGKINFDSYCQEYTIEKIKSYLSKSDYFEAIKEYNKNVEKFLEKGSKGEPYSQKNKIKENNLLWIAGSLVAGFLIAYGIGAYYKSQLNNVHNETSANNYILDSEITNKDDVFIRNEITKTARPKSSSSSSSDGDSSDGSF